MSGFRISAYHWKGSKVNHLLETFFPLLTKNKIRNKKIIFKGHKRLQSPENFNNFQIRRNS